MVNVEELGLEDLTAQTASELLFSRRGFRLEDMVSFLAKFAQVVNSKNEPVSLFYPMSGPDIFTPLLVANPNRIVMLEKTPVEEQLGVYVPAISKASAGDKELLFYDCMASAASARYYIREIFSRGITFEDELRSNLFPFAMIGLLLAGVAPQDVVFTSNQPLKRFTFAWKHPNDTVPRQRQVIFVNGTYSPSMNDVMKRVKEANGECGFDIMLNKASMDMAETLLDFFPILQEGGFIISDKSGKGELPRTLIKNRSYSAVRMPDSLLPALHRLQKGGYYFGYADTTNPPIIYRLEHAP